MLAQKHRFHRRNHIQYVYRKGRNVRDKSFSIRYLDRQQHADFRAAVVVSKKISKRAVVRNRIRRRLYAVIRGLNPPLRNDVDILVTVYDETVSTMEHGELTDRLCRLLDSARLRQATDS